MPYGPLRNMYLQAMGKEWMILRISNYWADFNKFYIWEEEPLDQTCKPTLDLPAHHSDTHNTNDLGSHLTKSERSKKYLTYLTHIAMASFAAKVLHP